MNGRRRIPWGEIARLAVLALVVVLPRVLFLDADPPGDLHVHFITDEGWWAHNARQQALFGRWIMDDHNPPLWSTPAYSFLLWLFYQALGVGLYQTRLLSGLAGAFDLLRGVRVRAARGLAPGRLRLRAGAGARATSC